MCEGESARKEMQKEKEWSDQGVEKWLRCYSQEMKAAAT